MKIRYDVRTWDDVLKCYTGTRFEDKREAFVFAKELAKDGGEALMTKVTLTDLNDPSWAKSAEQTCVVNANGTWRYLN